MGSSLCSLMVPVGQVAQKELLNLGQFPSVLANTNPEPLICAWELPGCHR